MNRTPLSLLSMALLLIASPPAFALGLGELNVRSPLGAPLQAEINIIADQDEEIGSTCFRMAPPHGDEDIPWIRGLRLQVRGQRLLITTREPVDHPIAMLAIQAQCGLQLRRDYTLLLQPPLAGWTPPPQARETAAPATLPARSSQARIKPVGVRPPHEAAAPPAPRTASERPSEAASHAARTEGSLKSSARAGDKLEVSQQARSPAGPGAPAPGTPLTHEQAVLAAIEDRITLQHELNEKLDRLERYQIDLRKQLEEMERRNQQPGPDSAGSAHETLQQAAPHATPGGPVVVTASVPPVGWWGLGGLAIVGLSAGAFLALRRHYDNKAYTALTHAIDTSRMSPQDAHQQVASPQANPLGAASSTDLAPGIPDLPGQTVEWHDPSDIPVTPVGDPESTEEQDSALELAEIMLSFGRTQGAAEALAEYIRNNPRQAVKPWLKLLEVYHFAGMQAEFEVLSRQLNKTFNVRIVSWQDFPAARNDPQGLEQLPHITERLTQHWRTREAQAYIHQLLRDNRNGTRQGFSHAIVEELLMLQGVLSLQLGAYKPPREHTSDLIISQSDDTMNIHLPDAA
jgi:hypothetical protein